MNTYLKVSLCGFMLLLGCSVVYAQQDNQVLVQGNQNSTTPITYGQRLGNLIRSRTLHFAVAGPVILAASNNVPLWASPYLPHIASAVGLGAFGYISQMRWTPQLPDNPAEIFPEGDARTAAQRIGNEVVDAVNSPDRNALGGLADATVGPVMDAVGNSLSKKLVNPLWEKITSTKTIAGITAVIGLYFIVKYASNRIEAYLHKPQLNYSVKKAPLRGSGGTLGRKMIFAPEVRDRLNTILGATHAIKSSIQAGSDSSLYKNLLLYGPSGSGKRMFAEQLAHYTRMDFYEVPWSLFTKKFKTGEVAQAVENFFSKEVASSANGALVFIDNAQMLFSDRRSYERASQQMSEIINALTEYAEKRSNNYMIVFGVPGKPTLAAERALIVDDIVEITLPDVPERKKLLSLYRDQYFRPELIGEEKTQILNDVLNTEQIEVVAKRLKKASAAELAAFMKTVKIESELPQWGGLSKELIETILKRAEQRYDNLIGG